MKLKFILDTSTYTFSSLSMTIIIIKTSPLSFNWLSFDSPLLSSWFSSFTVFHHLTVFHQSKIIIWFAFLTRLFTLLLFHIEISFSLLHCSGVIRMMDCRWNRKKFKNTFFVFVVLKWIFLIRLVRRWLILHSFFPLP